MEKIQTGHWHQCIDVEASVYKCGHCNERVSSAKGYYCTPESRTHFYLRICPHCGRPTYFEQDKQVPGAQFGNRVDHVPKDIDFLYNEARDCIAANAYTAAVLLCRKLLMHIAVELGAKPNLAFAAYVDHLANKGYLPPNSEPWVKDIKDTANVANHEIVISDRTDAERLISFLEMILRFLYEFPGKVKTSNQGVEENP